MLQGLKDGYKSDRGFVAYQRQFWKLWRVPHPYDRTHIGTQTHSSNFGIWGWCRLQPPLAPTDPTVMTATCAKSRRHHNSRLNKPSRALALRRLHRLPFLLATVQICPYGSPLPALLCLTTYHEQMFVVPSFFFGAVVLQYDDQQEKESQQAYARENS